MSLMDRAHTVVTNNVHQSSGFGRRFLLSEIQLATNNFSDAMLIGRGGFGKVYKGFVDDGTVAIKRLNPESKQGAKEFWTEIKALYRHRHPHLITLIGYSDDNEEMILVYNFMAHGTLADHLYKAHREGKGEDVYHLTWKQRIDICIGAARGLDYLHEGIDQNVIHRDVKTTNILLDEIWVPKISDFGLSKMGTASLTQTHFTTDVKGTFGYLDPQYFLTKRLTKKSDVYSFGVVLFEVLCGRPAVDFRVDEEQCNLAQWVQRCLKKGMVAQIIDPSLTGQISTSALKVYAEVANRCLHNHPKGRPTMAEVARSLELVLASGGNIPQPKGIITKAPLNIARFLVKGIGFGQRKLKNFNFKCSQARQLYSDPLTSKALQVFGRLPLAEIRAATNNFNEYLMVGESVHSFVYKGSLTGNLQVAVRRWKEGTTSENLDIFNAEIRVQSQLHHLHLVSIIGYCIEGHELITVYDYMVNDLHNLLYHNSLPWEKRLDICIGAARGLHYLHADAKQQIVHRNLNPASILLDQNWVAKLVGLEFPRVVSRDLQSTSFNPLASCTVGYMDPDYIVTGRFSVKSDVYSFGVILLEVLCGRKPMICSRDDAQVNFVQWFKTNKEMGTLDQIIDPHLNNKIAPECLQEYVKLAENCARYEGLGRPSMESVLDSLRYAQQLQETWQKPKTLNKCGTMLSKDVPLSQEKSLPKGILVVNKAAEGGTSRMSFTNSEDSDYMSANLAR